MTIKQFIISHELFQGFTLILSIDNFLSIKQLSEHILQKLISYLDTSNLYILVEKAKKMKLHHHTYKFISEIQNDPNDIIYLCSCDDIK